MEWALQRAEWTLLALAAAGGQPFTPVQLQKSVFLLCQAAPKNLAAQRYQFASCGYGPYDAAVYRDAEALEAQGLATVNRRGRWVMYAATPAGVERAEKIAPRVPAIVLDHLRSSIKWVRGLSFRDLVHAT
jgi:hypothetical protein